MNEIKPITNEKQFEQNPEQQAEQLTEKDVKISVLNSLKTKAVILRVGLKNISFSIQQARDLAMALRQNANFVEKHQ